ncbi:MAG: hypothetical protein ACK520_14250 [Inhella sp.]|jgi:hypothetical protein|uniref:hypothetical protein n=1 Tax=Inhella sp. TaxID=1921806 RepID=UPI0022C1F3CD|nr:hypothetical protein [Polaromonas sp.]
MALRNQPHVVSPFAQLIDPEAFSAAVAHSERLARLHRRVCRPLDKPLIPLVRNAERDRFDREVDRCGPGALQQELAASDAH